MEKTLLKNLTPGVLFKFADDNPIELAEGGFISPIENIYEYLGTSPEACVFTLPEFSWPIEVHSKEDNREVMIVDLK